MTHYLGQGWLLLQTSTLGFQIQTGLQSQASSKGSFWARNELWRTTLKLHWKITSHSWCPMAQSFKGTWTGWSDSLSHPALCKRDSVEETGEIKRRRMPGQFHHLLICKHSFHLPTFSNLFLPALIFAYNLYKEIVFKHYHDWQL